jgi:hyperosmotically inducible periplasmic protein
MRSRLAITTIVVIALAALATACKEVPGSERAADEARQAGDKAGAALQRAGQEVERGAEQLGRQAKPLIDDATLTAKVKAKLAADPEVTAYAIDVDTMESVVTLSGRVETAAESAEAEKLARDTEGVRTVVNRLAVGNGPIPGTQPSPVSSPAR